MKTQIKNIAGKLYDQVYNSANSPTYGGISESIETEHGTVTVIASKKLNNLNRGNSYARHITTICYKLNGKRISSANLDKLFN